MLGKELYSLLLCVSAKFSSESFPLYTKKLYDQYLHLFHAVLNL